MLFLFLIYGHAYGKGLSFKNIPKIIQIKIIYQQINKEIIIFKFNQKCQKHRKQNCYCGGEKFECRFQAVKCNCKAAKCRKYDGAAIE